MTKIDIDDAILVLVVRRKPNPETDVDGVMLIQPTNRLEAIRIQTALTTTQKTLLELTTRAVIAGAKTANNENCLKK